MTKLTRVTGKIFGDTADPTGANAEIGQFGSAKLGTYQGTSDVATIQGLTAWSNGWIDAVTPSQQFPTLPEMTGVHKVLSYQEAYLLQNGVAEWDANTDYYTDQFCRVGNALYYSLTDNNVGNNPTTSTANWKLYNGDKVDKAGSNGISANNQFTGDNTFTGNLVLSKTTTLAKENNNLEGGQIRFERADNDTLTADPYIDLYDGYLRVVAQVGGTNRVWQIKMKDMSGGTIVPQVSASASGYVVYGDGLKLQWGSATMSGKGKAVSFPTAFVTNNYQVIATGHATGGNEEFNVNADRVSTSYANFYGNYNNMNFGWLAIGY